MSSSYIIITFHFLALTQYKHFKIYHDLVVPVNGKRLCSIPQATEKTKAVNQEMLKKFIPN